MPNWFAEFATVCSTSDDEHERPDLGAGETWIVEQFLRKVTVLRRTFGSFGYTSSASRRRVPVFVGAEQGDVRRTPLPGDPGVDQLVGGLQHARRLI